MAAEATGKRTKKGGRRHTSFWPPVRRNKARRHIKSVITQMSSDTYKIIWETGEVSEYVHEYHEFKAMMKSMPTGVDCYVGDLMQPGMGFPWLGEAIDDKDSQVLCDKHEGVVSITIRQGNHWTTVASLARWFPGWQELSIRTMLDCITDLCTDVGTGDQPSPGALGASKQYEMWKGKVVTRPPNRCRNILLKNLVGGRVEYRSGYELPGTVYELDLRSAYASCCQQVPVGSTVYVPMDSDRGGDWLCDRFPTWYARCEITITQKLPVGPFAIRAESGQWAFPTEEGTYTAWLWKEEWLNCVAVGCDVLVQEGYAWEKLSNGLEEWVEFMEGLRFKYEDEGRIDMANLVKRCIVAAIGRFGLDPKKRTMIRECDSRKGDTPIIYKHGWAPFSDTYMRIEPENDCCAPVHWHSYILMLCRQKLYIRQCEEVEDGNEIIGANFDALYLAQPSKRTTGRRIGEWKAITLTEASLPFPRGVISKQKVTLPGFTGKKRQQYLHAASTSVSPGTPAIDAANTYVPSMRGKPS